MALVRQPKAPGFRPVFKVRYVHRPIVKVLMIVFSHVESQGVSERSPGKVLRQPCF